MRAAKMCTSGVVIIQVLVLLGNIDIVNAKEDSRVVCEYLNVKEKTLKCGEEPMICITSISMGTSNQFLCPEVPVATPNSNCSEELVKKYLLEKCNGKTTNCTIFKRYIEISPYCEKAIKYVTITHKCVSSPSECSNLESPKEEIKTTIETLPSLSNNMMAQKAILSVAISPTKAAETQTNIDGNRNPTSPLSKIPATTAQKPGDEISRNFSSLVPVLTSYPRNSWKKSISCPPKKTGKNPATISPGISSPKPPLVERNAGVLNICFIHLKVQVMVFACSIVFSLL